MRLKKQTKIQLDESPQTFDLILTRITTEKNGKPYEVCQRLGFSWGALLRWISEPGQEDRKERFDHALKIRAYILAEDTLEIADKSKPKTVQVDKLKIDTRFRLAAAFNPERFGEHREVKHSGEVTGSLMHILQSLPRDEKEVKEVPESLPAEHSTAV